LVPIILIKAKKKIATKATSIQITIIAADCQSTDFIVPPQKQSINILPKQIPAKKLGREYNLTLEYLRLLYLRCARKKKRVNKL
jgi:hypothetical protein